MKFPSGKVPKGYRNECAGLRVQETDGQIDCTLTTDCVIGTRLRQGWTKCRKRTKDKQCLPISEENLVAGDGRER